MIPYWEPRHPTYREGLESIVETWLEGGRLVGTHGEYAWSDTATTTDHRRNGGRYFEANTRACPHCDSPHQRPITAYVPSIPEDGRHVVAAGS